MENLLTVLAILFIALFALIFVLEKVAKPLDSEQEQKIARWIMPLMMLLIIAATIRYFFF